MGLNISLYKETIGEKNELSNSAIPNSWQLKLNAAFRKYNSKPTEWSHIWYNKRSLVQTWLHFDYSFYYWTLLENTNNLFLPWESTEKNCPKFFMSAIFWFVFLICHIQAATFSTLSIFMLILWFSIKLQRNYTDCKGSLVRQDVAEKSRNSSTCLQNIFARYRILKLKIQLLGERKF